jgi:hypothetical protein
MSTQPIANETKWSDESIIDLVRKVRNDLIKDFLDERFLIQYIDSNYKVTNISQIKIEFIKNNLKELLISPVNLAHYQTIIADIRENDSASLTEGNDVLFYKEIEQILKRYIY